MYCAAARLLAAPDLPCTPCTSYHVRTRMRLLLVRCGREAFLVGSHKSGDVHHIYGACKCALA